MHMVAAAGRAARAVVARVSGHVAARPAEAPCWVCVPGEHGSMCRRHAIEVRDAAWRQSRPGYRASGSERAATPPTPVRRSEWRRWSAAA
jgi:hypothetical protein